MKPSEAPAVLPGCSVLPSMHDASGSARPARATSKAKETTKAKGNQARRQPGDRFAVLNALVDCTMQELSRGEVLVWLALFRDTKPDGLARTGQADLARRIGANVGTVKRAVGKLRGRGLLTVVFRGSLSRGPSVYRVHPLADVPSKGAPALPSKGAFHDGNRVRPRHLSQKGPE